MLFGVPNRGAHIADTISGYLKLLSHIFNVNQANLRDLKEKSYHLMRISDIFRQVQKEHDFPVLSVYESEVWSKTVGLVSNVALSACSYDLLLPLCCFHITGHQFFCTYSSPFSIDHSLDS